MVTTWSRLVLLKQTHAERKHASLSVVADSSAGSSNFIGF